MMGRVLDFSEAHSGQVMMHTEGVRDTSLSPLNWVLLLLVHIQVINTRVIAVHRLLTRGVPSGMVTLVGADPTTTTCDRSKLLILSTPACDTSPAEQLPATGPSSVACARHGNALGSSARILEDFVVLLGGLGPPFRAAVRALFEVGIVPRSGLRLLQCK